MKYVTPLLLGVLLLVGCSEKAAEKKEEQQEMVATASAVPTAKRAPQL